MTKHEVKEFFLRNTGFEVTLPEDFVQFARLEKSDLYRVLEIFKVWSKHVPYSNRSIFLNSLVNDLIKLHCCAVSGHPASPCYVGKHADCIPTGEISVRAYSKCRLPLNSKAAAYDLGKFI